MSVQKVDDKGLHITINDEDKVLDVDTVILCAGQVSVNGLYHELKAKGLAAILSVVLSLLKKLMPSGLSDKVVN